MPASELAPTPSPRPIPAEKSLAAGIPSPESAETAAIDTGAPATERLAPRIEIGSAGESFSFASGAAAPTGSQSPELTLRQPVAQSPAPAPLPVLTQASASGTSSSLAPIPVSAPAQAAVRTTGAAPSPLSTTLASVQRSAAFFASTSAALTAGDVSRTAAIVGQELSPKGRGNFGTDTFKSLTLTAGGIYYYDFVTTGRRVRNDLLEVGSLLTTATEDNPFTIYLTSYSSPNKEGLLPSSYWDPRASYEWLLISSATPFQFNPDAFALDDSGFRNNLQGGFFSLSATDTSLVLNFTPVPEPSTWVLLLSGAGLVAWLRRRTSAARS
ncbi:PEP-CTERM sorting domain-containing protein [Nibricoccus sp. IMCC34717]|uniref:PEP-CTERM sorting domain-containing protein n=1 Tax=Nibricoccus sp. IMCC34717 TaxID=3034021 RepID=UPI00384EC492